MKLRLCFLLLFCFSCLTACSQETLEQRLKNLYRHTVPLIKPSELKQWQKNREDFFLLDTRSAREYEVSHIEEAEFVDYENFQPEDVNHLPKNQKVVVYCSVGYRSERIGEKLKELGFTEVYNLYGGIFEWKNQGYQVIDQQKQPTDRVHAYNRQWGKWLENGIKVYD